MAQNITVTKHAVAGSSRLRATTTGDIYDIKATADIDNGCIIGKGKFLGLTYYEEGTATAFKGKIISKASNGNYYIEVTEAENAYLVLSVPLVYDNHNTTLASENTFYNAKDDIMRCYKLFVGDIFELSLEGFEGTPEVDKEVSIENKKLKVATA